MGAGGSISVSSEVDTQSKPYVGEVVATTGKENDEELETTNGVIAYGATEVGNVVNRAAVGSRR
jgi:hypothetical protein